ncbi:MAG: hypothetical protein IJ022_05775 [Burkholderiaceae bacterium]|nr:hypothetical protein [Burkholderiaceae bacterium]
MAKDKFDELQLKITKMASCIESLREENNKLKETLQTQQIEISSLKYKADIAVDRINSLIEQLKKGLGKNP